MCVYSTIFFLLYIFLITENIIVVSFWHNWGVEDNINYRKKAVYTWIQSNSIKQFFLFLWKGKREIYRKIQYYIKKNFFSLSCYHISFKLICLGKYKSHVEIASICNSFPVSGICFDIDFNFTIIFVYKAIWGTLQNDSFWVYLFSRIFFVCLTFYLDVIWGGNF